jgi:hypothetical protein
VNHLLEIQLRVNGFTITAFVDSGAQGNYVSPQTVNRFQIPWKWKTSPYVLQTIDGRTIGYDQGQVRRETELLEVEVQQHQERLAFDITDTSEHELILGIPWLRENNPIIDWTTGQLRWRGNTTRTLQGTGDIASSKVTTGEQLQQKEPTGRHYTIAFAQKLLEPGLIGGQLPKEYEQYNKLFQEELETGLPEHSQWDHEIPLKPGTQPKFQRIYSLNEKRLAALRKYLDENLRKGYIRPSTSPAGYPILWVPKKNGEERMCVDYRQLNDITIKNRYPLPLISEMRDRLQGACWFTGLDLKGAYNLIRIKEGEEWKTAFRTRYGHYEYLVMPFGLTNAPASFQAMINQVLREYLDDFVIVYLDDILIFSKTLDEHKKHVHQVLKKLLSANLLVELKKSKFHTQEVDFLGCTIEPGKIRMQESKLAALKDWPTPNSVTDVRAFLGYTNFYRKFLKGYGEGARALTDLTKKDRTFEWTPEAQTAFETIRNKMLERPVLWEPDPEKPYEVECDASNYAIGGQLGQRDKEGRLHPVAFFSKKFHGPELNYPVHDKELMAVVCAFQEWKVYLIGARHQITVYSDHRNLTHFTTTKELSGRQARWYQFLSEFDFVITYRKGSQNAKADILSRRSDQKQDTKEQQSLFTTSEKGLHLAAVFQVTTERKKSDLKTFITELHRSPVGGHQGIMKTLNKARRYRDEPNMLKTVREVIRTCDECNKNKTSRHKPYGLLQPLDPPARAWESVSWDLIVKLPPSTEPVSEAVYDSILVIVDRLTKYAYFLPYKESHSAEQLAYTFLRNIVSNHGLPAEVLTDRGTTFASNFWQALMKQLGIKQKLTTSFHPQTNGQTERLNQVLEQYLRNYINYPQNDWVKWLPAAQTAYNSATTETTGVSPFFANYGFEPDIIKTTLGTTNNPAAQIESTELLSLHQELQKELSFVATKMTHYANKSRMKGPSLKEGDHVYLLRRHIKTKRPSDKLDHKKEGPFRIQRKLSATNYELSLPQGTRLHPRFHISLLEPAPKTTPLLKEWHTEDTQEHEVEAIIDHRGNKPYEEYLIKWKGYGDHENTWEPLKNLRNSQRLLRKYQRDHPAPPDTWTDPRQSSRARTRRVGTDAP